MAELVYRYKYNQLTGIYQGVHSRTYEPCPTQTSQDDGDGEPAWIPDRKLGATTVMPHIYYGRPTGSEMLQRVPAMGVQAHADGPSKLAVAAMDNAAAAVCYTQHTVVASDTPAAEQITAQTATSSSHQPMEQEKCLPYLNFIGATEGHSPGNFTHGEGPTAAYTFEERKPLSASGLTLEVSMRAANVSRAQRLRNRGLRRNTTSSMATAFKNTTLEWHDSTDTLVEQPLHRISDIPYIKDDWNAINDRARYGSRNDPVMQPPILMPEHRLRRCHAKENLYKGLITQSPANGHIGLAPSITLTPASPSMDNVDGVVLSHSSQHALGDSANLLQVPRARRGRNNSAGTQTSDSAAKQKPTSPSSASRQKATPNEIRRELVSCNTPAQVHGLVPGLLTSEDRPGSPSLQGIGFPYPPKAIPRELAVLIPRSRGNWDEYPSTGISELECNAKYVSTDAERSAYGSVELPLHTSVPQLPIMRRHSIFRLRLSGSNHHELGESARTRPLNKLIPSQPECVAASLLRDHAPDDSFPFLRKAAVLQPGLGVKLFGRDSLVVVLAAVEILFVVFPDG
ncbi:MAG: hypothetical protein Q9163_004167 [Psora crenata]